MLNKLNKKIIGIGLVIVISLISLCCIFNNGYKAKNKDAYNKGYNFYKYDFSEDMTPRGIIMETVDHVTRNNGKDDEVYTFDGEYLYTIKSEDEDDYEYGMLQFAIDTVKEEKEKDLYYLFENSIGVITGEKAPKSIKKYNEEYVKCYDEILDLLGEIKDKYGDEEIPREYYDEFEEIFERQEKILNDYANEMMSIYTVKILQSFFN